MSVYCKNCAEILKENDTLCPNCAYPQSGNKADESSYRLKVIDLKEWLKVLDSAGLFSLIVSAGFFAVGFILTLLDFIGLQTTGIFLLLVSVIYAMLFLWSRKEYYRPLLVFILFIL